MSDLHEDLEEDASDAPSQCNHEWFDPYGDDRANIYCLQCGRHRIHKFLVIDPSGETTILDDPEDEEARRQLIKQTIGDVTDHTLIADHPFLIDATVHDAGHLIGLKMHRNNLLRGLAGLAFLCFDSAEEWRGFNAPELSIVEEMLDEAGLMHAEEAEQYRPTVRDDAFGDNEAEDGVPLPTAGCVSSSRMSAATRCRLYENLPVSVQNDDTFHIEGPIVVKLIPYSVDECCRELMTVFYGVDHRGSLIIEELYRPKLIESLHDWFEKSDYCDNGFGTVKPRLSQRQFGKEYVTQGCPLCDVIIEPLQLLMTIKKWESGQYDDEIIHFIVEWPSLNIVSEAEHSVSESPSTLTQLSRKLAEYSRPVGHRNKSPFIQ